MKRGLICICRLLRSGLDVFCESSAHVMLFRTCSEQACLFLDKMYLMNIACYSVQDHLQTVFSVCGGKGTPLFLPPTIKNHLFSVFSEKTAKYFFSPLIYSNFLPHSYTHLCILEEKLQNAYPIKSKMSNSKGGKLKLPPFKTTPPDCWISNEVLSSWDETTEPSTQFAIQIPYHLNIHVLKTTNILLYFLEKMPYGKMSCISKWRLIVFFFAYCTMLFYNHWNHLMQILAETFNPP